jgi:hypothetical protein
MSSTQHKSLARSIEQWQNCDPHAMATRQSDAAIENAFVDAKHDVLALSTEVAALKALRDELVGALDDVIGWVPVGRTFWYTDAPPKSADRARAVLAKHAGSAS